MKNLNRIAICLMLSVILLSDSVTSMESDDQNGLKIPKSVSTENFVPVLDREGREITRSPTPGSRRIRRSTNYIQFDQNNNVRPVPFKVMGGKKWYSYDDAENIKNMTNPTFIPDVQIPSSSSISPSPSPPPPSAPPLEEIKKDEVVDINYFFYISRKEPDIVIPEVKTIVQTVYVERYLTKKDRRYYRKMERKKRKAERKRYKLRLKLWKRKKCF